MKGLLTEKAMRRIANAVLRSHRVAMSAMAAPYSSHVAQDVLFAGKGEVARKGKGKYQGLVQTNYHWAEILDAGRPPVRARPGKLLVWFRDWRDDPRTKPAFSRHTGKLSRVRRLTKREFIASKAEGLLVIAKRVRGVPPTKFIARGGERGRLKVRDSLHEWLDEELGTDLALQRIVRGRRFKGVASVRLT